MRRSFKAPEQKKILFKSLTEFSRGNVLGSGAFATVFEAFHRSSGIRYAIKQINLTSLSSMDQENIEKELEIHSRIAHPFIIQLYDFLIEENSVFLILEFAPRGNLFRHMNRKKMPEIDIRRFFVQTALAIDYLHSQRVIMRDLKPENLLLDHKMNIKLCDLGWAASLSDTEYCKIKAGTYAYMSPESLQGHPQTEKSDMWSLGIFLYELCYNKEPYTGSSCHEQLYKIETTNLDFQAPINGEAQALIIKLLKFKANDRMTMDELFSSSFISAFMRSNNMSRSQRVSEINVKMNSNGSKRMISTSTNQIETPTQFQSKSSLQSQRQALIYDQNYPIFQSQNNVQNHNSNNQPKLYLSSAQYEQSKFQQQQQSKTQIPVQLFSTSTAKDEKFDQTPTSFLHKITSIDQISKINPNPPQSENQNKPILYKPRIFDHMPNKIAIPKPHTYSHFSKNNEAEQPTQLTQDNNKSISKPYTHAQTPDPYLKNHPTNNHSHTSQSKHLAHTPTLASSRSPILNSKYRNLKSPNAESQNKGFALFNFANTSGVISSKLTIPDASLQNAEQNRTTSISNFDAKSFTNYLYRKARRMDTDSTVPDNQKLSVIDFSGNDSRSISPNWGFSANYQNSPFLGPILKQVPHQVTPNRNDPLNAKIRDESVSRRVIFFTGTQGLPHERPVSVDNRIKSQTTFQENLNRNMLSSQAKTNNSVSYKILPANNNSNNYNIYKNSMTPHVLTGISDSKPGPKEKILTNIYSQAQTHRHDFQKDQQLTVKPKSNIFVNIDLNS